MHSKFFNSMTGSYVKIFLSGIVVLISTDIAKGVDIFHFDIPRLKEILIAGLIPVLPILLNYLNKADNRYGKKEEPKDFPPENKDIQP